MLENILTISIIGLAVGFMFSVPVAGPISILITSHALKGEGRYCMRVAVGAAIFDFIYCFIAVFGFAHIYLRYERTFPFILTAGSLLIFYYGVKILRTRLDLEHLDYVGPVHPRMAKVAQEGGFRAGLVLNFLNPSLFIGWLTSSFLILSFAASLGFNVGHLNDVLSSGVGAMNNHALDTRGGSGIRPEDRPSDLPAVEETDADTVETFTISRLVYSLAYALSVGLGTIVWFYYFSRFLIRRRQKLNVRTLNRIVQSLGAVLCLLSVYLLYIATRMFLNLPVRPRLPL
jgi:threonine/homoserine/homoserine lactone efflux protein